MRLGFEFRPANMGGIHQVAGLLHGMLRSPTAPCRRASMPVRHLTLPHLGSTAASLSNELARHMEGTGVPRIDPPEWRLHFAGLFERPRAMMLKDIRSFFNIEA